MPHKKVIYRNKETPFEIKSEGDWKKIKKSWYVSYICNKCGERHIKIASNSRNAKNTCLKKTLYFSKKTPFEINSEEDWKKVNKMLGCNVSVEINYDFIENLKYEMEDYINKDVSNKNEGGDNNG